MAGWVGGGGCKIKTKLGLAGAGAVLSLAKLFNFQDKKPYAIRLRITPWKMWNALQLRKLKTN